MLRSMLQSCVNCAMTGIRSYVVQTLHNVKYYCRGYKLSGTYWCKVTQNFISEAPYSWDCSPVWHNSFFNILVVETHVEDRHMTNFCRAEIICENVLIKFIKTSFSGPIKNIAAWVRVGVGVGWGSIRFPRFCNFCNLSELPNTGHQFIMLIFDRCHCNWHAETADK